MPRACLPEIGHVGIQSAGKEWLLVPSLNAMSALGGPAEVVSYMGDLYSFKAKRRKGAAIAVITACCVEGDPFELAGYFDLEAGELVSGEISDGEAVEVARHLMKHAMVGKASKGGRSGGYTEEFNAAKHMAAAVAHLGMSMQEAGELTMTELHLLMEAKFPEMKRSEVPTREEYYRQMNALAAKRKAANV